MANGMIRRLEHPDICRVRRYSRTAPRLCPSACVDRHAL